VNRLPGIVAIVAALLASSADYPAAIAYFSNLRQVKTVPAQAQNYIALDDSVWAHARADLGDLRLYDGETQVPYALRELRGGIASVAEAVKILNLATTGGHTEFDLDTGGGQEYNRIELQLAAKDFVNRARIEGRNQLNAPQGAHLGSSTLYDFTRENLGRSVVLRLPLSSFQYVHVRLDPGITAEQVQGAEEGSLARRGRLPAFDAPAQSHGPGLHSAGCAAGGAHRLPDSFRERKLPPQRPG